MKPWANNIIAKIDKTQYNSKAEESVHYVSSECHKLAQKEYKRQHDWFEKYVFQHRLRNM